MTQHEQDHDLNEWLASYDIPEIGIASRNALLSRIMAQVPASPQRNIWPCALSSFASRWGGEAAALAAAAVLGFWIGLGAPAFSFYGTTVSVASTSVTTYLGQTVFGPASWREVSL
ncbi:MAG: hypothetical protein PHW76_01595 [Alphaproteobacteria bacterium]|nr:hypothetical protein [Alphaproteobacteria bacterium]